MYVQVGMSNGRLVQIVVYHISILKLWDLKTNALKSREVDIEQTRQIFQQFLLLVIYFSFLEIEDQQDFILAQHTSHSKSCCKLGSDCEYALQGTNKELSSPSNIFCCKSHQSDARVRFTLFQNRYSDCSSPITGINIHLWVNLQRILLLF